jgi:hypothetical protein
VKKLFSLLFAEEQIIKRRLQIDGEVNKLFSPQNQSFQISSHFVGRG